MTLSVAVLSIVLGLCVGAFGTFIGAGGGFLMVPILLPGLSLRARGQWMHADFEAGWLRLEPGETKNREGRMFPLLATLRAVLERQRAQTRAIERATGQVIPWVFYREGRPIKHYRRAWLTAYTAAGVPHRIPHDFGVPPSGTWSARASRGRPP